MSTLVRHLLDASDDRARLRHELATIAARAPEAVAAGVLGLVAFGLMLFVGLVALPYWLLAQAFRAVDRARVG